jgi:YVTN family beta-propeller protein
VHHRIRRLPLLLAAALLAACDSSEDGPLAGGSSFLAGTSSNPDVGVVLNSLSRSLTLFQAGDPAERREIALGASEAITPTGAAVRGRRVAVPLGNAAGVAVVSLATERVERVFTFPGGNATGAGWVDDETIVAANLLGDYVGRMRLSQGGAAITDTAHVAPAPTVVAVAGGRVLVVSGNLADDFTPLGDGVVSAVDPQTMRVTGTVGVGPNPQAAAVGPDGKLYVLNTGDYVSVAGSVSIVNPATLAVEATVPGFGLGPGAITIGADGLAYVSSYSYGTVVWSTATRQFVRGPADPLCATVPGAGCRGAGHASAASDGTVYQAYLGTTTDAPRVFAYRRQGAGYAAPEEIAAGTGPVWVDVRSYR